MVIYVPNRAEDCTVSVSVSYVANFSLNKLY